MRYTPPQNTLKKNLVALSVVTALSFLNTNVYAEDFIYKLGTPGYAPEINRVLNINESSGSKTFDNIDIELTPPIANDRYTVSVAKGQSLIVNGDTSIKLHATEIPNPNAIDIGTNALYACDDGSTIHLNGNVTIVDFHDVPSEDPGNTVGANAVYANENASINLGSEGTKTVIWALAEKPDAISAKSGGDVIIHSKHNQIVGSIDMTTKSFSENTVKATFSGTDSYWFGDEQSFSNGYGKNDLGNLIVAFLGGVANLDLIFENGAQWSYFGIEDEVSNSGADVGFIVKRISNIRLQNGGIINLFDEDIQNKWKEIGLSDLWPELKVVNHDYVRIGELKGNGGIFRLDLNSDPQSKSDMIFVESSSAGTHFIEPYRPQYLTSVSDSNRLTFAFTSEGAAGVSFADKQNIYGESLYDYELGISSEVIDENNQELIEKLEEIVKNNCDTFTDFDINDYLNGRYWYINRLLVKQSAAAIGMRSAGYASYDAAVSMDRHDRRLQDAVFQNENKEGLWTRIQYGEVGAEHLYNADLTTVYVGYETPTSDNNRLGVSFAYTDGNSDFQDLKGSGELKRYEASVYDTLTFGPHYLDFVARFGQVDNEFDVVNQSGALSTSGSFDQKYAAVSAEYGYRLIDTHNVFIEPQLQIQAAYLDDYSYKTERNMRVKAENDVSVIGRAGFRAGKYFRAADKTGELYARADVLHQFTDGQDAEFSDLSSKLGVTWGDKDTWATFGVGGYMNWKDNVTVQLDVERTAGGETIDTWQVSGRLNYLF